MMTTNNYGLLVLALAGSTLFGTSQVEAEGADLLKEDVHVQNRGRRSNRGRRLPAG